MASWVLYAETNTYQELGANYQVKIYHWTTNSYTTKTLELMSDLELTRGSGSASDKFKRILTTKIKFILRDEGTSLYDKLKSDKSTNFKCEILKNGSSFFSGYINLLTQKIDPNRTHHDIEIRTYDGIKELKNYSSVGAITSGEITLGKLVYEIFDFLGFDYDVVVYQNMYPDSATTPIKPLGAVSMEYEQFAALKDDMSYYDALEELAKIFDWTIFQNNGNWVIRQNYSIVSGSNVIKNTITTGGSISVAAVSLEKSIANDVLQIGPKIIKVNSIKKIILSASAFVDTNKNKYKEIGLNDPYFLKGDNTHWTDTGTVEYHKGYIRLVNLSTNDFLSGNNKVEQITDSIAQSKPLKLEIDYYTAWDGVHSGFIDPYGGELFICEVMVEPDSGGSNQYLQEDGTWSTYSWWHEIDFPWYNSGVVASKTDTFELEFSLPVPGKVKITLFASFPNDDAIKFFETCEYHRCILLEDISDDNQSATGNEPNGHKLVSYIDENVEEKEEEILMHDANPEIKYSFHNDKDGTNTTNWLPDNQKLIEYTSKNMLKFNSQIMEKLDIAFLPSQNVDFESLLTADLDGDGSTYFLIMYEKTKLLSELQEITAIEHKDFGDDITTELKYEV